MSKTRLDEILSARTPVVYEHCKADSASPRRNEIPDPPGSAGQLVPRLGISSGLASLGWAPLLGSRPLRQSLSAVGMTPMGNADLLQGITGPPDNKRERCFYLAEKFYLFASNAAELESPAVEGNVQGERCV